MYHLRLIKALSYSGAVEATKQEPDVFVEDGAAAEAALRSGYFVLIEDGDVAPEEGRGGPPEKTLEEMTVAELETFAAYKGVTLKGISRKADIIAKLKEELGGDEAENEADYGSPTMAGLQER